MTHRNKLTENPFYTTLKDTATEKWGISLVDEILPALERLADAIWAVENHKLTIEEEPAFSTSISNLAKQVE
jgi:hypothetical protein